LNNTSNRNRVCAIIPFYNEEKTISEIITRTLKFVDTVIAVDDGSTDNSYNCITSNKKVILLKHQLNKGKGRALNTGFKTSFTDNFDITITLDADLQHPPEEIPNFVEALNHNDIVIGNRLGDLSSMPVQRILSNKLSSGLLSLKTGLKIIDSQCGFRGFRTKILKNILPHFSGYEAESEMLILAARKNYNIGFVSIPTIYNKEKSKVRAFNIISGFIRTLLI
jgi:UDP-N-acetylglucosamine---dolichyl-phosphate N-acetylglucosaminyltransferase